MAHRVEIADEAYQSLVDAAKVREITPRQLLEEWLTALRRQPVRGQGTAESETNPSNSSIDRTDPWRGFLGVAEASSTDVVERHDHYLAEAYAGIPANTRDAVR